MCPDRELLSAWVDGEVPSPWRETIEHHTSACADCSATVRELRRVRDVLTSDASRFDAAASQASDRVLAKLGAVAHPGPLRPRAFWARRYSVPLPAAAAAALLVALLGLALFNSGRRNAELQVAVRKAIEATSVAASGMGMESVIDFISRQDSAVNINITLPAEAFIGAGGEPFIVREADYRAGTRR